MTAPGFLTETRERFLKAILAQLPIERIRELYLFQPMKQGGVESGVAVVAAWIEAETPQAAPQPSGETTEPDGAPASAESEGTEPPATVDVEDITGSAAEAAACEVPAAVEGDAPAGRPTPEEKYTVYTARYRHVLKGPDRGKWDATVVAEADAPLLSIESVVRGVQQRAGDVEGPDHMRAADIRAALRLAPAAAGGAA